MEAELKEVKNSELNTEQMILEAAEAEFLEKGYGNAKMLAIAKRAGVSHSMLHYYFRTKENLFQMIFMKKVQTFSLFFEDIFDRQLPFDQTVRLIVETQFGIMMQNPRLPHFILNEIIANKENRELMFGIVSPKVASIGLKLNQMLCEQIEKGTIRPIGIRDFVLNIASLNISTFIMLPVLQDIIADNNTTSLEQLLLERRESNVQYVLSALRP